MGRSASASGGKRRTTPTHLFTIDPATARLEQHMKLSHTLLIGGLTLLLLAYLEAYFEHPTYGRGLRAIGAALELARFA